MKCFVSFFLKKLSEKKKKNKNSFKTEHLGSVTTDLLKASSQHFNLSEHLPLKALILPNDEITKNKTPKETLRGR